MIIQYRDNILKNIKYSLNAPFLFYFNTRSAFGRLRRVTEQEFSYNYSSFGISESPAVTGVLATVGSFALSKL